MRAFYVMWHGHVAHCHSWERAFFLHTFDLNSIRRPSNFCMFCEVLTNCCLEKLRVRSKGLHMPYDIVDLHVMIHTLYGTNFCVDTGQY